MRTSNDPRPIGQQGLQLGHVANGIRRIGGRPPLDRQAQSLGNADPRSCIGFMVEFGQNQLVAVLELQGRREIVQKLGGGHPDTNLGECQISPFPQNVVRGICMISYIPRLAGH